MFFKFGSKACYFLWEHTTFDLIFSDTVPTAQEKKKSVIVVLSFTAQDK